MVVEGERMMMMMMMMMHRGLLHWQIPRIIGRDAGEVRPGKCAQDRTYLPGWAGTVKFGRPGVMPGV